MAFSINTNIPSLRADRQLGNSTRQVDNSLNKLSSGKRINKAADDPASLAVALELLTNADTGAVASRNISDAVSVVSIADSALSTTGDITTRMAELATQASNGTLSDDQRAALNNEYQQLSQELDRISQTTEFNGQSLLANDSSVNVQAGTDGSASSQVNVDLPGVSAASLGLVADISTQAGAQAALDQTKAATQNVASSRAELGASESRLNTAFNNLKAEELNNRAAASRILDADIAKETANLTSARIRQQAGVAVKAQANTIPSAALKLIG